MVNGKIVQRVRNFSVGLTPIVVGLVLVNNQTLIPFLPEMVHLWGGWIIVGLGVWDLFNNMFG